MKYRQILKSISYNISKSNLGRFQNSYALGFSVKVLFCEKSDFHPLNFNIVETGWLNWHFYLFRRSWYIVGTLGWRRNSILLTTCQCSLKHIKKSLENHIFKPLKSSISISYYYPASAFFLTITISQMSLF